MDRRSAIVAVIGAAVVIVALLVVALSGDDDEDVIVEDESPDVVVTETETEVVVSPDDAEVSATPTTAQTAAPPSPPATVAPVAQTYIVGPQEPITTQTSEQASAGGEGVTQFAVVGRYDGEPLPDSVELAPFPCDNARPTAQPVTFVDQGGDGEADGLGETATGSAVLHLVNGERVDEEVDAINWPLTVDVEDDQLTFAFESFEPDCLVPVVFSDENDNSQLDLDDDGVPTEPFGVGRVEWTS